MIIEFKNKIESYDNLISVSKGLAKEYKNILSYVTIGKSHDNRDILLLKLGLGQRYLICCGGVHARETINPLVLLRIIEYYADLYNNYKQQRFDLKKKLKTGANHFIEEYEQMLYSSCIYELLQTYTILFVPLLNPDGYMISLEGFEAIQDGALRDQCLSMKLDYKEWKYNARGIDINRNFPSKLWTKKAPQDKAASENETKALISLFNKYKSEGFLDFHSRGRSIYYYRSMMSENYNVKQLQIANRLKDITNYVLVPPVDEIESGDSGGNTVHYYSEYFHKPALTIETVDEDANFPLDCQYYQSTFEELKLVISEFGSLVI